MAMRAVMSMAAPRGLGRLFATSTFNFTPPPPPLISSANPPAEPNPNVFVSGLSKRTTTEGLREAFSKFGEVVNAKVVTDRVSGFSKGYGFVRYATTEEASAGIQGMDGKETILIADPWQKPSILATLINSFSWMVGLYLRSLLDHVHRLHRNNHMELLPTQPVNNEFLHFPSSYFLGVELFVAH